MSKKMPVPRAIWRHPVHWLAFGCGTGLAPVAPGTFGTLLGIPLYYLLSPLPVAIYCSVVLGLFLIGIALCQITARDLGVHDHPGIVWDEIVGYLITMIAAPAGIGWLLWGFVLFRLFDIVKPWPIRWLDRHAKGGFGIMIDDVLAGVFALLCLQLTAYWIA